MLHADYFLEVVKLIDRRMSHQLDTLRDRYMHVIFPFGVDAPSLRTIPLWLRAIRAGKPRVCTVLPSECGKDQDGLFAIADLPIGTTFLFGGVSKGGDPSMDIKWGEWNESVSLPNGVRESFRGHSKLIDDDGVFAWKANEPWKADMAPNAVILTSPEGIYLTVCRTIKASPDNPKEVVVDYGDHYCRRGYSRVRYKGHVLKKNAKEDLEHMRKAIRTLICVPGIDTSN